MYVRISVDRDDQTSTSTQERICRDYANSRGWEIVGVEIDRGRSAYKVDSRRPGLDKAMKMIRDDVANVLIVWKLDRFVRSVAQFGKLWPQLDAAGASFVSVTDSFDTTTAMGRAMLQIAVVFAELESGIKSERIGVWHDERRRLGSTPTGPRPFGYCRPEGGGLDIEPSEADEIREMARRVLAGDSLSSITRDLNARSVPTASPQGVIWRNSTVRRVLTSPTTAALREIEGVLRDGAWSPILDRNTWDDVRTVILDPERRVSPTNQRRWLLSGRLACGRCGSVMRGRTSKSWTPNARYMCSGGKGCAVSAGVEIVDELVTAAVLELIDRQAWDRLRAAGTVPAVDVEALEAELVELAEMHANGEITMAEWKVMRQGIQDRVASAEQRPVELPAIDDVRAGWPDLTLDARWLVISAVIDKITISPAVRGARSFDPDRITIDWRV